MNGLPSMTKEEEMEKKKANLKYVSATDFFPNSYNNSPKKKPHSNTFKTQVLGLFN